MMLDVIIGLLPAVGVSVWLFRWYAVAQLGTCVLSCLAVEALLTRVRGQRVQCDDLSAVVTGLLLGMSLPALAPPYIGVIGSLVAIGLGKVVFGGLGYNLFNPAMVGRAFVMLSFAAQLGAPAYVLSQVDSQAARTLPLLTQATPLTVAKKEAMERAAGGGVESGRATDRSSGAGAAAVGVGSVGPLLIGKVNGSVGETSALALLVGGIYLCFRRAASWEIPTGVLLTTFVLAQLCYWFDLTPFDGLHHVLGGAALLGAFFIATDPVSSPLTPRGKLLFAVGVGLLLVLIRVFSGYSEGLMFAVLLMNATVPLINRWTIPAPLGSLPAEPT